MVLLTLKLMHRLGTNTCVVICQCEPPGPGALCVGSISPVKSETSALVCAAVLLLGASVLVRRLDYPTNRYQVPCRNS